MNLQDFYKEKEKIVNDLIYGSFDLELHIKIAKFIENMEPEFWYIIKGEEYKGKDYKFLQILTQSFLDNADSDRWQYVVLIMQTCPPQLKEEILSKIKEYSNIPFVYDGLT